MRSEIYRKYCLLFFILSLSGCASAPDTEDLGNGKNIAKQLQELEQMKPGLKRLVAMEGDLKSLIEQLNAMVDTATTVSSDVQSDNTIVATYEQKKIDEKIVQQNSFEPTKAKVKQGITSSVKEQVVTTEETEPQNIRQPEPVVAELHNQQQEALTAPVYTAEPQYGAQLASLTNPSQLESTWEKFRRKHVVLDDAGVVFEKTTNTRGDYYRVKAGPYQTRIEAKKICSALKSQGQDCIVTEIKNEMVYMLASLTK